VEAYRQYAEDHEKKSDDQEAVSLYKKCLTAAADAHDLRSEGLATYRLGLACAASGDKTASIEYHQRYLEICKRIGDQLGEGQACAALAHSFKDLGDTKLAIRYLEKYLDIATRNKQSVAQAEACAALGGIYSEEGEHDRAVTYFEKTFEIARAVGDRKLVDSARINLGMARGNMTMGSYMGVVTDNLPALLKWKTRRTNF
jgi:tetratricopeptide (TPR) repeat protein